MELRKSGKLAIGIVAAMGTIGALHIMVFKDRAAEYQRTLTEYNSTYEQYKTQGAAPDINDIYQFRYNSLKEKVKFWETVQALDVSFPDYHFPDDSGKIDVAEQQQKIWDVLDELVRLQAEGAAGNGPRLTFMDDRVDYFGTQISGWNVVDSLPEDLAQRRIAVDDLMTNLRNEDKLLKGLDPNRPVYEQRRQNYEQLLAQLGLNLRVRQYLEDQFGALYSTLVTLNRIRMAMDGLPENYFREIGLTEQESLDLMYELFRLEWPKDFNDNVSYLTAERQGRALVDMITVAAESGIQEVMLVKFHDVMPIYWTDPESLKKKAEEEEQSPDQQMMDMSMFGMEGFGGAGEEMMMGFGRGFGMGMMATPTPAEAFQSIGAPVEVWVKGSNASVMSYLYNMTHSRRPMELDRLRLVNVPEEDDQVIAMAFFNVVTYAEAVGPMKSSEVAQKISEAKQQLVEIAKRPAVRDQAVEEGILVKEAGNQYVVAPGFLTTAAGQEAAQPAVEEEPMTMDAAPGG